MVQIAPAKFLIEVVISGPACAGVVSSTVVSMAANVHRLDARFKCWKCVSNTGFA